MKTIRRSKHLLLVLITLLLILVNPASARIGLGGLSVDEATTLWQGVWEVGMGIEAGSGYVLDGNKLDIVRVPTSLSYGWQDRVEVNFRLPFSFQQSDVPLLDGSGLSDVSLGLKYQMSQDEGNTPASSTEVRMGWGPNSVVGSHAYSFGLLYAVSKAWRDGESWGHLNLGYTFYSKNRNDVFSWGAAYERRLRGALRGSVGISQGTQMIPGLTKDMIAEIGLAKESGRTLEYTAALGIGVSSNAPTWQIRTGIKKEFGGQAGVATAYRKGQWAPPPEATPNEIVHQGEMAMRNLDYEQAVLYYKEALSKDSTIVSAWNNMGIALFNLGRTEEALSSYEFAARLNTNDADVYYNIGLVNYRLGNLISAKRAFARAIELNPEHEKAMSNLIALQGLKESK